MLVLKDIWTFQCDLIVTRNTFLKHQWHVTVTNGDDLIRVRIKRIPYTISYFKHTSTTVGKKTLSEEKQCK